jgi:hypothetical protein
MANITKYIVTGRRPELAPAVATALAPVHPWGLSPNPPHGHPGHIPGLHGLLGEVAWRRLPATVRARFSEPIRRVDYVGEFDIVRASLLGRAIAWVCTLIGTPIVPRTGQGVGAIIHVGPVDRGASWLR